MPMNIKFKLRQTDYDTVSGYNFNVIFNAYINTDSNKIGQLYAECFMCMNTYIYFYECTFTSYKLKINTQFKFEKRSFNSVFFEEELNNHLNKIQKI